MSWIVQIAKLTQPNFRSRAEKTGVIQLLGISISHFCEFSSWILMLNGVKFEEHAYAPLQHVLPVIALRVGDKNNKFFPPSNPTKGSAGSVPIATLPDGRVLRDSWEIATFTKLKQISDPSFQELLDKEIGPITRALAYAFLLKPQNVKYLDQLITENHHWLWRLLYTFIFRSRLLKSLRKSYAGDAKAIAETAEKLSVAVEKVNDRLIAKKTKYFGGDTVGVEDIALASLLAPALNTPDYCNGKFAHIFHAVEKNDSEMAAFINRWREHPVGKYAQEIYTVYRKPNSN